MSLGDEERLTIQTHIHVERARRVVRAYSTKAGLSARQVEELVLAASELAENLVKHAAFGGVLICRVRETEEGKVVEIEVQDQGPGIADLARALEDGYSTTSSMGSGLPSARRLVDSFQIESSPSGTRIKLTKRTASA